MENHAANIAGNSSGKGLLGEKIPGAHGDPLGELPQGVPGRIQRPAEGEVLGGEDTLADESPLRGHFASEEDCQQAHVQHVLLP